MKLLPSRAYLLHKSSIEEIFVEKGWVLVLHRLLNNDIQD